MLVDVVQELMSFSNEAGPVEIYILKRRSIRPQLGPNSASLMLELSQT
jgi:hypothetical protein